MIKNLLITYLFLITNVFAGLPPTTVKGQAEAVKTTTFNVEVPYSQATTTAAGTRLLEVGNNNILANGSFEHSTYDTGWTCSLGTKTKETTTVFKGKNSMKIVSAGAGTRCYNYSTTDAAKLKGQQGHATVRVNSTDSVLQVCALAGGTTSAFDTNCVTVPVTTTETPWKTVVIPTIMDGTGNGVVIKSAETLTKTVFVDEVEYKHGLPVQAVNGARLLGTVTITGCSAAWTSTSTSLADFPSVSGCTYSTTGQALAPTTNIPAIRFSSLQAGDYVLEYDGQLYSAVANINAYYQFGDGTNLARENVAHYGSTSTVAVPEISQSISYSTAQSNITLAVKTKVDSGGSSYLYGTNGNPGVIKVWYFPPVSTIYTDFNKGYSENAGEVFPYAGTVCPSGTLAADGSAVSRTTYSELFAKIGVTHGQGDGSTTFNVPDYRGRFLRGVDGTAGNDPDKASRTAMNTGGNTGNNVGSIQLDAMQGHRHGFQARTELAGGSGGSNAFNNPNQVSAFANVLDPITDGTNGTPRTSSETRAKNAYVNYCIRAYNKNITGSFENIEKCADALECVDEFTVEFNDSGVITRGNEYAWVNGNATYAAGEWTVNFTSGIFTVAPICQATPFNLGASRDLRYYNTTTSSIKVATYGSGSATQNGFSLTCKKTGVDYKPKTAKVAVSTGVNRTDGVERPVVSSVQVAAGTKTTVCTTGSCTLYTNKGGFVSAASWSSTGTYNITLNPSVSSVTETNCIVSPINTSGGIRTCKFESPIDSTSEVVKCTDNTNSPENNLFTIMCHGSL